MKYLGTVLRALYAAAITFVGALAQALTADQNLGDLDAKQWLLAIGATLAAFGGVYGISNVKT